MPDGPGLPDARLVVTIDTNDEKSHPELKKLNPILQEILLAVAKSPDVTNRMRPTKFGRLTFSKHG